MGKIHFSKVGDGPVCVNMDEYRLDISLYIVQYQSPQEDLPPYVWHLDRVYLSKSQAIARLKKLWQEEKDDENPYCDTAYRILVQRNNSVPTLAYTIDGNGKIHKAKKHENEDDEIVLGKWLAGLYK